MTFIEKLAKGTEAVVEAIKWPFREASIKRQADDVVDEAEQLRLETETKIVTITKALTTADDKAEQRLLFKNIVDLRAELAIAEDVSKIATAERDKLFAEAAE
jgi:hypothetical protein